MNDKTKSNQHSRVRAVLDRLAVLQKRKRPHYWAAVILINVLYLASLVRLPPIRFTAISVASSFVAIQLAAHAPPSAAPVLVVGVTATLTTLGMSIIQMTKYTGRI